MLRTRGLARRGLTEVGLGGFLHGKDQRLIPAEHKISKSQLHTVEHTIRKCRSSRDDHVRVSRVLSRLSRHRQFAGLCFLTAGQRMDQDHGHGLRDRWRADRLLCFDIICSVGIIVVSFVVRRLYSLLSLALTKVHRIQRFLAWYR